MKDAEFTSPRNASDTKIDAWAHAIPKGVLDRLVELPSGPQNAALQVITNLRALFDMDDRFRTMDRFENYTQVLTPIPGLHLGLALVDPNFAENLVRRSNDGLADSVAMHPDRFDGFAGLLPLNDPDRSLVELDRLMQIGALGVQIESSINGVPLDDARYEPIFAKMADLQRPIWLHPVRSPLTPDYPSERISRFAISTALGWPYETSVAMARLVFSGRLERHPNLKIIAHHGGGMVPQFSGRLGHYLEVWGPKMDLELGSALQSLKRPLLDYFKMFYVDTAMNGARHAVACVLDFFGPSHILFGTDTPFDPEEGRFITDVIADVNSVVADEAMRKQVFHSNALAVLGVKGNRATPAPR